MKKIKDIYPKIMAKENLYRSAYMAARGRRYRDTTADFNFCLEEEIGCLHNELSTKSYRHGEYRLFTIYDPKERRIAAAPFRDRVVHHAVHDVIEPIIDKTFIYDSYACRVGKGSHKALYRAQGFLQSCAFCLHGDIRKYFYSINHGILKEILRMRVEDSDLLWLLDQIIDSAVSLRESPEGTTEAISKSGIASSCFAVARSPRNDERRGLPIGNLTSQFFANLYLNELDYFIKFDLKLGYYLRYMDDFLIFSNDKNTLFEDREKIKNFLKNNLELQLHEGKSQVYKTKNGIKFLGFRIFKDYRRLASDNVKRFRKRVKKFAYLFENAEMDTNEIRDSVRCWVAHSKYADTKKLRLNIWSGLKEKNKPFAGLLKEILLDGITGVSERERERERERGKCALRKISLIYRFKIDLCVEVTSHKQKRRSRWKKEDIKK